MEKKDKKRTLTINANAGKNIKINPFKKKENKQSFTIEKKKQPFFKKDNKKKSFVAPSHIEGKKKPASRKFIEKQATKDFIKKDNKPAGKSKLKLKGPVDKRDFKLTVSRARKMQKFMSQPFFVAEQFTGFEGRYVSLEDTVSGFEAILNGEVDDLAENSFAYVGTLDEAIEKDKKAVA